ncbi:MAG: sigma-70 family RNA polymerase sigma factor [Myxococcota bacterium]
MYESQDDKAVMDAVASGHDAALGELYDRHCDTMMSIGMGILGNRTEVEDVLHDVWVEIWERSGDYDPDRGTVSTWIMVRMRSRCLDRVRRVGRKRRRPLDAAFGDDEPVANVDPSRDVDKRWLQRVLVELPDRLTEVIDLIYFRGMTSREAASEADIPIGTVKSRLRTARRELRERASDDMGGQR